MSREQYLFEHYFDNLDRLLCHAKGELLPDEYLLLLRRIVQQKPELKEAAQQAAFVEAV